MTLPRIGKTEASIRKYFAAVNNALVKGEVESRTAEVLIRGARGALDCIKQNKVQTETDELREMLREAQGLVQARTKRVIADRHHAEDLLVEN